MKLPSSPEYEVRVRYATEHRCGVVMKGPKLSGNISGTDPLKDNRLLLQAQPLDDTEEAKHTVTVLNELSKEISKNSDCSSPKRILEAPGGTGDYQTLLTSKENAIAKALSAPMKPCPNVFVAGEDEHFYFGIMGIK
ncbi:probable 2,3-bisphosphoglycerate-independent phosphoglycerate mutase [Tanacetum coccineum]